MHVIYVRRKGAIIIMQTTTLNIIDTEVGVLLVISGLEQKGGTWEAYATDIHANPYVLTYTTTKPIVITTPDTIALYKGFCRDEIYFAKRDGAETLKHYLLGNLRKGDVLYCIEDKQVTKIEVIKRANDAVYFSDGNHYSNKGFSIKTGGKPRYLLDSPTNKALYEAYQRECAEWEAQLHQHKADIIQAITEKHLTREQVDSIIATLNEI